MRKIWYVRRRDEVKGPFNSEVVERLIAAGRIHASDEISPDRERWQPVAAGRTRFADPAPGASPIPSPIPAPPRDPRPRTSTVNVDQPPSPRTDSTPARSRETAYSDLDAPASSARAGARREPRVRGRRSIGAYSAHEDSPRTRLKQITTLVGVMSLIVLGGIAFLPSHEGGSPDCLAGPGPAVNWSNCRHEGRDLKRAVLSGASLRSARLSNAQMVGAKLVHADLAFADLAGANLAYGDLRSANAMGADLRGADLAYADLRGANLSHADLTGANLGGADLGDANLDHAIWIDQRICHEGSIGGCRVPVASTRQAPGERPG